MQNTFNIGVYRCANHRIALIYILMINLCVVSAFYGNAQDTNFVTPLRARGYSLFPSPQRVDLGKKDIFIDGSWSVKLKTSSGDFSAKRLSEGAKELHNLSFGNNGQRNIILEVVPDLVTEIKDTALSAQSYQLSITSNKIHVTGKGQAGLFYGVQSLLQLIRRDADGRMSVPECEIHDWPGLQFRFSHWDTKNHQDRIETLKHYLDQASFFKINAIAFEIYDKYEFPSNPVIGAPGAFTKAQMQDLTRYAAERFIQLIPNVQAPAHMAYVLKHPQFAHLKADGNNYQACICDDESLKLIFGMYQDMIDATPGVDYFLVSTDEVYYAGICDKCKLPYNEENRSLAWTQFAIKAHEWLTKRGRRMIAWIEYPLLKEHIEKLPSGIIDGALGSASYSTRDWVQRENKAGISQLAYISMQGGEPLFPNYFPSRSNPSQSQGRLKQASEAISTVLTNSPNLVGTFAAAWDDAGLHNETFWLGWATVAQYGWNINKPTIEQSTVDFMDVFYGYSSPDLVEIYQLLDEGSRFYSEMWDRIESKEVKRSYGNSNGKGIGGIRYDRLLTTPKFPEIENIATSPEFRIKYAQKIEKAQQMAVDNDKLIELLLHNIAKVKLNSYNLEVLLSIAYLQRFTIHTILNMAAMEDKLIEASKAGDNHRRVVSRWLEASQLAQKILKEYQITWPALTGVWEKSQFKRNRSVNGRDFLNVIPDVNDYGDVSRRTGLDYMVAPFERIGLKKWKADLDSLIDEYAKKHGIADIYVEDEE